jgi:hypothetical protein
MMGGIVGVEAGVVTWQTTCEGEVKKERKNKGEGGTLVVGKKKKEKREKRKEKGGGVRGRWKKKRKKRRGYTTEREGEGIEKWEEKIFWKLWKKKIIIIIIIY